MTVWGVRGDYWMDQHIWLTFPARSSFGTVKSVRGTGYIGLSPPPPPDWFVPFLPTWKFDPFRSLLIQRDRRSSLATPPQGEVNSLQFNTPICFFLPYLRISCDKFKSVEQASSHLQPSRDFQWQNQIYLKWKQGRNCTQWPRYATSPRPCEKF